LAILLTVAWLILPICRATWLAFELMVSASIIFARFSVDSRRSPFAVRWQRDGQQVRLARHLVEAI
jgi:hypothetical protein